MSVRLAVFETENGWGWHVVEGAPNWLGQWRGKKTVARSSLGSFTRASDALAELKRRVPVAITRQAKLERIFYFYRTSKPDCVETKDCVRRFPWLGKNWLEAWWGRESAADLSNANARRFLETHGRGVSSQPTNNTANVFRAASLHQQRQILNELRDLNDE